MRASNIMSQAREQREEIAKVIGAQLANDFLDAQLPAIVHCIRQDPQAVRACAREASRPGTEHPARLVLWMMREKKHTGSLPDPQPRSRAISLPPPDPQEVADRKLVCAEWKRIQGACRRSQDFLTLYQEYQRLHPNASHEVAASIRAELIEVLDEMNSQKEART